MTRFGLEQHILDKIVQVLREHPQIERAVIYGSRADGRFKPESDIDIAIFAPTMELSEFARLRFELCELPIVFKLDVVHVDALENETLRREIVTRNSEFYSVRTDR